MKHNKAETPGALIRSHVMTLHQPSVMPQSTISSLQEKRWRKRETPEIDRLGLPKTKTDEDVW